MNKLKLFLTFDHELPLGGLNTNYEKALFEQKSFGKSIHSGKVNLIDKLRFGFSNRN